MISIRGARENNLKNLNLEIPRNNLVVFTGVSGSGKSSLAFGTLYAEAQRRYLESVSPYARRLFNQMKIPDVDSIEGLPTGSGAATATWRNEYPIFSWKCYDFIQPDSHAILPGRRLSCWSINNLC